ncbi:MAG: hypothetical protein H7326_03315 [Bdellovibrionaceae bacterium]|nr:hypothetical protein [Pseudobdellovibrionaceae bacterium]
MRNDLKPSNLVHFTESNPLGAASLSVDPAGNTPDNQSIVDIGTVPDFKCSSFIEINAMNGQVLDIPARTQSGVCYLPKLISAASFNPSNSNTNIDNDLVSRNYDLSFTDSTKILVDNFILVGLAPSAQIGDPAFCKAYGTNEIGRDYSLDLRAIDAGASGQTSDIYVLFQ